MSFSFNFDLLDDNDCHTQQKPLQSVEEKNKKEKTITQPAFEVKTFYDDKLISKLETKTLIFNEYAFEIVDTSKLEHLVSTDEQFRSSISESTSLCNIVSHSDLVGGVYEGGLKVWECGIDLTNFLSATPSDSPIEIAGKTVLELGCGAGLPGLYCAMSGATHVDFQDYNEEVLKLLTHTNVEKNIVTDDSNTKTTCHYFAGDWGSFCDLNAHQAKYDIILSAETIYNVDNYHKLHKVFDAMLADDGIILIAAKVYYFGVGGSVDAFLEFLHEQNCFVGETVWETKSGVPRKILILRKQKTSSGGNVT